MDGKYENTVIECMKWRSLIKNVVVRNIAVLSKTGLDVVWFEYGEIVNYSEISNGIDEMDDVWNQSNDKTCLDQKLRKSNRIMLTVDEIRLMV